MVNKICLPIIAIASCLIAIAATKDTFISPVDPLEGLVGEYVFANTIQYYDYLAASSTSSSFPPSRSVQRVSRLLVAVSDEYITLETESGYYIWILRSQISSIRRDPDKMTFGMR